MFGGCVGDVLGLCWGDLGMCWECVGDVLGNVLGMC